MSANATQATPPNDPGPQAANTPAHRAALDDLINIGAGIARHLHAQADAQAAQPAQPMAASTPQATDPQPTPAPAPPAPDALIRIAASFDQVARAVRRCIALAQSLDGPKQQYARHPAQHPAPDRTAARKRIIRAIEDTIQRPPDNPDFEPPEVLLPEFRERMDAPDLDADIASRPVADIIKEICRDLGLAALPGTHPWKRRTPADIAELNARAAAPSRPTWTTGRQPGPAPQEGPAPQDGHPTDPQPAPDPQQDGSEPASLAKPAAPRPQPGPARAPSGLPQDPAEAVAFVLHHTARTDVRWRPPPDD